MKNRKLKASPKLNWRLRDKIIQAIFKGQNLFIKNTGVKISVEHFGNDGEFWGRDPKNSDICKIVFESVPTGKALKLVRDYSIHKNSHTNSINSCANIDLYNLSLIPFETASAKLLYDKTK